MNRIALLTLGGALLACAALSTSAALAAGCENHNTVIAKIATTSFADYHTIPRVTVLHAEDVQELTKNLAPTLQDGVDPQIITLMNAADVAEVLLIEQSDTSYVVFSKEGCYSAGVRADTNLLHDILFHMARHRT